ncbi:Uncharacterised protein, partial [Mesomycoplasma hyorhinis]
MFKLCKSFNKVVKVSSVTKELATFFDLSIILSITLKLYSSSFVAELSTEIISEVNFSW